MFERLNGPARMALLMIGTILVVGASVDARPASAESAPGPDVRVTYVAKAADSARTTYTFLVTNVGDAEAAPVQLMHETTQARSGRRTAAREQSSGGATVVTLAPRESMTLTVVCAPEPEHACIGAEVRAATPDDRDTRDNQDASR